MKRHKASVEPRQSAPDINLIPLQTALNQAETALQICGPGLQLQIAPNGDVELVRRTGGPPTAPQEPIARLIGCDPLLWRRGPDVHAPTITLGPRYPHPRPRCVLSGVVLTDGAPLELYYRGQPVSVERAMEMAPLLVLVRNAVLAASSELAELDGLEDGLASVENGELRAILVDRGVRKLARRWVGVGGVEVGEGLEGEVVET